MSQRHPEILKVLMLFVVFTLVFNMISCKFLPYSVPSVPKNVTLLGTTLPSVEISWTETSTRTESFIIERDFGFTDNFTQIATPLGIDRSFVDNSVVQGTQYRYRIKAIGNTGFDSGYSDVKQVITPTKIGTGYPHPTQFVLFANPSIGHYYELSASTGSIADPAHPEWVVGGIWRFEDKWTYDKDNENAYVYPRGDILALITDDTPFKDFYRGQFVVKLDGSDSWQQFTTDDTVNAVPYILNPVKANNDTEWYCGIADSGTSSNWSNNWGFCVIEITDVTN